MILKIKIALFILTVISIKLFFVAINEIGDKKVDRMKEIISFTDYLKVYSCDMKMSIDEILEKYNFRNDEIKIICNRLPVEIKKSCMRIKNSNFASFIESTIMTPNEFNSCFAEIANYYGSAYSDVLEQKLSITRSEMDKCMKEYDEKHKEKKNMYNKVSILFGCLTAVIFI